MGRCGSAGRQRTGNAKIPSRARNFFFSGLKGPCYNNALEQPWMTPKVIKPILRNRIRFSTAGRREPPRGFAVVVLEFSHTFENLCLAFGPLYIRTKARLALDWHQNSQRYSHNYHLLQQHPMRYKKEKSQSQGLKWPVISRRVEILYIKERICSE